MDIAPRTGFDRSRRLLQATDFDRVMTHGRGVRTPGGPQPNLAAKFILNADYPTSRIGLIVGKRSEKKAVRRNTIKRVMRETFRLNCAQLTPLDLVVRVTKGFAATSSTQLKAQVRAQMQALLGALPSLPASSASAVVSTAVMSTAVASLQEPGAAQ